MSNVVCVAVRIPEFNQAPRIVLSNVFLLRLSCMDETAGMAVIQLA